MHRGNQSLMLLFPTDRAGKHVGSASTDGESTDCQAAHFKRHSYDGKKKKSTTLSSPKALASLQIPESEATFLLTNRPWFAMPCHAMSSRLAGTVISRSGSFAIRAPFSVSEWWWYFRSELHPKILMRSFQSLERETHVHMLLIPLGKSTKKKLSSFSFSKQTSRKMCAVTPRKRCLS